MHVRNSVGSTGLSVLGISKPKSTCSFLEALRENCFIAYPVCWLSSTLYVIVELTCCFLVSNRLVVMLYLKRFPAFFGLWPFFVIFKTRVKNLLASEFLWTPFLPHLSPCFPPLPHLSVSFYCISLPLLMTHMITLGPSG